MGKFDTQYQFCVNVKNRKIHYIPNAKTNCYRAMDAESPKYFNNLPELRANTNAILQPCKLCMGHNLSLWQEVQYNYFKPEE